MAEIIRKALFVAFLDVNQAFDKVCHKGLLYKIKQKLIFPHQYFHILNSRLIDRWFQVKYKEECSSIFIIRSGVPQGSVLGSVLRTLYIADLPYNDIITTATFADDTAERHRSH